MLQIPSGMFLPIISKIGRHLTKLSQKRVTFFLRHCNFKSLASTVPEIWSASQNFDIGSRDPFATPYLIFQFFSLAPLGIHLHDKFLVSSFNRSRDYGGDPKVPKLGHVTLSWPPLTKFSFFSLVPLGIHQHAKFRVSSFNRSRDMEGSQNSKIRSRDPSRSVNTWLPATPYFDSTTPICLFTIQLSRGYDDD